MLVTLLPFHMLLMLTTSYQDPCLSLAFDYAEHDLYEMIRYHREKLYSAPLHLYTIKSITWQLLQGLAYLHQNWILHRCA